MHPRKSVQVGSDCRSTLDEIDGETRKPQFLQLRNVSQIIDDVSYLCGITRASGINRVVVDFNVLKCQADPTSWLMIPFRVAAGGIFSIVQGEQEIVVSPRFAYEALQRST